MIKVLKRSLPGSFGAALGITIINVFRYSYGVSDFLLNFVFMFVCTWVIVTAVFWIWDRIRERKRTNTE